MDIRSSIPDFILRAKELQLQLRNSEEAATLTRSHLHMIEVQMYLLGKDVQKRKEANGLDTSQPSTAQPGLPPFTSAENTAGEEESS